MTSLLLDTKLYAPRRRSGLVPRPQLTERLRRGTESKLTLVSAPAGFGKSTLLAEWLAIAAADGSVTAWLSLDPGDNHPVMFWTHLIAALQTAAPGVGASASSLLGSPDPPIEAALASLLNELNSVPNDIVLVLDDYHTIDEQQIQAGMTYVLEHLPDQVHLAIATRVDPALPLARLRARGELAEIRAVDLRFTPDEAAAYFNGVMNLGLTARDVAALEGRTEGWIAALQLAGLSMQGRDDITGFITGFAGDDRYIVDYLVEEVLQREPEDVRSFLLQTSILARMSGPLCDAVTGRDGGKAMLEVLDRRNLFLIPLDDRRRWYRYHHLFADVLQAHLLDELPDLAADLHRRATEWFEQNGERSEAIRHAMAGKDFARAADLVELAMPATGRDRQEATLRRWLEALPDELIRARPVLSNGYAGSILVRGETDGVEARLRDAEGWLDGAAEAPDEVGVRPASMVVADEDAFRRLPGMIAIHRAGQARLLGDVAGTIAHARRALDLFDDDDQLGQGGASALLGLAYWTSADLEAASGLYAGAMPRFEKAGHLSDAIGLALALADMRIAQGRLREAMSTYERGLELATGQGALALRGAADMHVGISEILRERDDLMGAAQHLHQARDLGDENGLPQNPYRSRVAAARIRQAEGDLDGSLQLLDEAERLYANDFSPDVRPVAALKARARIAQGKLSEASAWAGDRGLSSADDLSYVREFEYVTLARLLLAQGSRDRSDQLVAEATDLLERLLVAAESGGRTGTVIEILVVLALARHARDDVTGALASLGRAVALAEPEGYVRIVVDEGRPIAALLKLAAKQPTTPTYVRRLLAAAVPADGRTPIEQSLIEPLSERELEVLRLLDSDLDGPDVARELTLSLATVRTHTRNIYAKLGVNNRRAAVRRADELGLLSRTRDRRPSV
ncbi:MAG TPA: LuxR C-terminal-related transcriptional regulator [Candidatus Limnocylindrales bacterium]|nr:LuxR C-terminal-related transcriptional regulator [Candidatus Limnocylindrales bacterium]